jgi:Fic family protein
MENILFLIIGVAIGFYVKGKTTKTLTLKSSAELADMREESTEALKERTEERKKKILDFMSAEARHQKELQNCSVADTKQGITSADIEKLLDVGDDTARKYLNELEQEGRIEQVGTTGKGVYYKLK